MLRYRLVFNPQPLPGFTLEQVQSNLRQLLKLNDTRLHQLYINPQAVLKKDLEHDKAEAYLRKLAQFGIAVRMEPEFELSLEPIETPEPEQPAPDQPTSTRASFAIQDDTPEPAIRRPEPLKTSTGTLREPLPAAERLHASATRHVPMQFTGNGREYFGIWIINIVLTVLTLGIYSAWAKVRNRQYFYGNTLLDGNNFQYLADPKVILRGRIIAFFVLVAWNLTSNFMPILSLFLLLAILPAIPWVLARSLRFNAINSAYRGVRFNFVGTYGGAAKVVLLWPFVSAITFSLGLPLSLHQKHKYQVENSRYGLAAFQFNGTLTSYYLFGLKVLLTIIAAGVLAVAVHPLVALLGYLLVFGYFMASLTNLYLNNIALAGHRIESSMSKRTTLWIYFSNSILIMLTLGLYTPWAKVRMARYRAECTTIIINGDLDKFVGTQIEQVNALGQELGDMFDMDMAII
ncbi:YjgN family protein [Thiopseudomonas denitrificans]|uniref:Uncharacterized membrane protein YjgN (DUF898 family) n=1 Tax=Thiopseudomonas denitrificans TaxID=1501432 RepID=A0A4R6TYS0_9GAMM|nr:YjgN family protein [Thiopseudomonas denitrificans]TDQ38486.1 uncharacterized membrane protein YjgN (DUF898 family) [Thiopseudomonas denitrificans]